jgi:amicyanin
MKRLAFIALPLVALTLAACGGSSSNSGNTATTTSPAGPAATTNTSSAPTAGSGGGSRATVQITMKSLAFSPAAVHAKVGATVKWTNDDTPPHNVTYVSGPKFTSSPTMNPGATFSIKLTQPGTIHYFCSIHPFMKATIVVTK